MLAASTILASVRFSTLDYLVMLVGFLDLAIGPLSLLYLISALLSRRGQRTSLRVLAVINIFCGALIVFTVSGGGDQVFQFQIVLWTAVLIALAIPAAATKLFGAPPDTSPDDAPV